MTSGAQETVTDRKQSPVPLARPACFPRPCRPVTEPVLWKYNSTAAANEASAELVRSHFHHRLYPTFYCETRISRADCYK